MGKKSTIKIIVILTMFMMVLSCTYDSSQTQSDEKDITIGIQVKLYSDILNEERTLLVNLPPGYEESNREYPVLYLLDGGQTFRFSKSVGTVGALAFGNIPKMVLVGIKNTDRERDMFPMKTENDPTSGGGDNFLKFISEELIPFIDKNFRTKNFRILSGTSNSAFFTVYALFENPDLFSACIASSPTLLGWIEDLLNDKIDELNQQIALLNKRLFLIYGEYDFPSIINAIPGFTRILEDNAPGDFIWGVKMIKDEGHVPYNSEYEGLQFVFSDWKYPGDKLKDTTFQEVKAYYSQLSKKYGYDVDIPVMVLINLGNELINKNDVSEALEILEFNVVLYPVDPMAHFYLGLAYEKKGETQLAIEHIKKAVDIDPSWSRAKRKLDELNIKKKYP